MVSAEFKHIYARSASRQAKSVPPGPCWCGLAHSAKAGHSVSEWRAMAAPDPTTNPDRHATWKSFQSDAYDPSRRTAVTTEPNENAIAEWQSKAKKVPQQVAGLLSDTRRKLRTVERRADLSQQDRDKLAALVRRDGQSRLQQLAAEAKRAEDALSDLIGRQLKPKAGDTATELRQQAAWNRALRILDRTPDSERYDKFSTMVERAAKNDDGDLLAALWAEGPGYAESEGWRDAEQLRAMLAHIAAPPTASKAFQAQQATKSGMYHVSTALGIAEAELKEYGSVSAGNILPGWDGKAELYEVADETEEEVHESEEQRLRALLGG